RSGQFGGQCPANCSPAGNRGRQSELIQFGGQCPPNLRIGLKQQSAVPQRTGIQAPKPSLCQVVREPIQKAGAVSRPIFSVLLKLHDVSARGPVAEDEGLVDNGGGASEQVLACRV